MGVSKKMKIIKLQSENFKRLVAVEIEPKTHVVKITGKNGQGKTSCLDSIWALIAGERAVPKNPIHEGANKAVLYADLGELEAKKIITPSGSRLEVKYKDKIKPEKAPQKILDKLYGRFMFDPREFSALDSRKQYFQILSMVKLPNIDDALEAIIQKTADEDLITECGKIIKDTSHDTFIKFKKVYDNVYDTRTIVNREVKRLEGAYDKIEIPSDISESDLDLQALLKEKEVLVKEKTDRDSKIQTLTHRKEKRDKISEDIEKIRIEITNIKAMVATKEAELCNLETNQFSEVLEIQTLEEEIEKIKPVVFTEIDNRIMVAQNNASILEEKRRKIDIKKTRDIQKKHADELTSTLKRIEDKKVEILKQVEFPVENLSLGDGYLLYNEQPFDQASDAERLLVSCMIAVKENPKLRVVRIRDGSLMDSSSWEVLEEIAEKYDFQILVEVVADGPGSGIYIEDGMVK